MRIIETYLEHYGYLTLLIGLLLEYIALPFPGELVMGYSGYMVYKGELHLATAIFLSWLGTSVGMTVTYFVGRKLGYPFLVKHGPRFFLSAKKLEQTTESFRKYGTKLLFFSFFIPGVRHFTGYLAGILNVPYRKFALYTYTGALFWVVVFIGGGRILGAKWESMHAFLSGYGKELFVYSLAVAGVCLLYARTAGDRDPRMALARDGRGPWQAGMILIGGLLLTTTVQWLILRA